MLNTPTPFHVLTPILHRILKENQWTPSNRFYIDGVLSKIGSIELIQSLLQIGYHPTDMFMIQAADINSLSMIQFAKENRFPCTPLSIQKACSSGSVECLDYLIKEYPSVTSEMYKIVESCMYGRVLNPYDNTDISKCFSTFKYLIENGFRDKVTKNTIGMALLVDQIEANQRNDLRFQFLSYLDEQDLLDYTNLVDIFEHVFNVQKKIKLMFFRRFLDVSYKFKRHCFDHDFPKHLKVSKMITKIKEAIKGEKAESKVLEASFPSDILRYVIWNYL